MAAITPFLTRRAAPSVLRTASRTMSAAAVDLDAAADISSMDLFNPTEGES